ncbi:MAG TPA: NAD(P)-dependent oxidoreductase, partial [Allosphingosinicella sp.]|nr:NAD(P)-dependent oxidoreductase [Allosphingosinicella sp.]
MPSGAPAEQALCASAMARIAFIGLGVMGAPMARHLAAAGHNLTVYNRTADKARAWVQRHGGTFAPTPAAAAGGAEAVISCVGADADVAEVTLGSNGAFRNMAPGTLFIDHTTISARGARRIAEAGARQAVQCVDAPVSGGQAGAENRQLAIMCGGSAEAMAAAEPIMKAYAARIVHVGPAGAGQLTKMVNQIAIAGVVQGLAEAIHFAKAAALDTDKVFDAVSGGAAQSWQMVNRWKTMNEGSFDFGFAVD